MVKITGAAHTLSNAGLYKPFTNHMHAPCGSQHQHNMLISTSYPHHLQFAVLIKTQQVSSVPPSQNMNKRSSALCVDLHNTISADLSVHLAHRDGLHTCQTKRLCHIAEDTDGASFLLQVLCKVLYLEIQGPAAQYRTTEVFK